MKTSNSFRPILSVLALTMTLALAFTSVVEAGKLKSVDDVLTDSGPSVGSNHTISFTLTSGLTGGQTINVKWDNTGDAFNLGSVVLGDIDLATGTCGAETDQTLASSPSGTTWGVTINSTTDEITFESGTSTVAADDCAVIKVGTNASGGTNQIVNPASTGIYDVDLVTTQDTGKTKLAIRDHVTVDVTVDETLAFTITGQTSGQCSTTVTTDSSATAISFGSVNLEQFYDACQELSVSTNASDGYSVTVQQDGNMTSALLDEILAETCDGACTVGTEGPWATATNSGFAYCVEDVTGTDAVTTNDCASGTPGFRTIATIGTGTPEVIMSNTGVVSGSVMEIQYQLSVDAAQPAGFYTNQINYVATPTY